MFRKGASRSSFDGYRTLTKATAVAAAEADLGDRRQQLGRGLLDDLALLHEQRAFPAALVDHRHYSGLAHYRGGSRNRLVQDHALLAVHDLHPVDAGLGIPDPEPGVTEHRGHGRKSEQPSLVDVAKLPLVEGIVAEADPEGVEDGVPGRVLVLDLSERPVLDLPVVEGHTGSQPKTSCERSSG